MHRGVFRQGFQRTIELTYFFREKDTVFITINLYGNKITRKGTVNTLVPILQEKHHK